jgi:hypothetical protein
VIQYPWGADVKRVNYLALAVVVLVAFVASSLWYSPLLFGRQFLELSGLPTPAPNAAKALCELLRTFVLAFVIARLVLMLNIADWKGALAIRVLALDWVSCRPAHGINALAERTLEAGGDPLR